MKAVMVGENRLRNVVAYISPKMEGFEVQIQHQFRDAGNDGTQDVNSNTPLTSNKLGTKGGTSASLSYTNEEAGLYAAIAADRGISSSAAAYTTFGKTTNVGSTTCALNGIATATTSNGGCLGGTSAQRDTNRAVVTYKPISNLLLTAVYNSSKLSTGAYQALSATPVQDVNRQREDGYLLGSAYSIGDETIKVEYAKGEAKETNNKSQVTLFQVGVDHNFTSKTKAFAWVSKLKADDYNGVTRRDAQVFSVGLFHKF